MTATFAALAALTLAAWWINRPSAVRAQRDLFWLRELAIHDHAIEKGLERWTDTRRVEWYTPHGDWQGHYDEERDRLRDRDELEAGQ